jgi:hypothetical protein
MIAEMEGVIPPRRAEAKTKSCGKQQMHKPKPNSKAQQIVHDREVELATVWFLCIVSRDN